MLMLGEPGRTSLNKSRTLGNTLLYRYLRKVQRISPPIFQMIPCTFCAVIETFLLANEPGEYGDQVISV